MVVNDAVLNAPNAIDVYQAFTRLDSDASVQALRSIAYKAGFEINLNPGFNVELGAVFIAEIENCLESISDE